MKKFKKRAVFLDRDGTINYDFGYVYKFSDFIFRPHVIKGLKFLSKKKYLIFIVFLFKNYKFLKQVSVANFILLSAIISLILEAMPIRTTGSLFTTNNATYLILIASIVLSYKKILQIKIE